MKTSGSPERPRSLCHACAGARQDLEKISGPVACRTLRYCCPFVSCPSAILIVSEEVHEQPPSASVYRAGFPGQKAVCRLGKQQSKWLCSDLASPATTRLLKGHLHQSPPPKSTIIYFSRPEPSFSGHTISHQVEGHAKTRQQST